MLKHDDDGSNFQKRGTDLPHQHINTSRVVDIIIHVELVDQIEQLRNSSTDGYSRTRRSHLN